MKLKLLDLQKIHGLYIERSKNLPQDCYEIDEEKSSGETLVFKKVTKEPSITLSEDESQFDIVDKSFKSITS